MHTLGLSGDGRLLSPTWGVIGVLADRQSVRLPLDFGAETPGYITIDTVMFPTTRIIRRSSTSTRRDSCVTRRYWMPQREAGLFRGTTQGKLAVIRTFVASGIHHILIGPDHILFLFGLLLLGGSLTRLAGS